MAVREVKGCASCPFLWTHTERGNEYELDREVWSCRLGLVARGSVHGSPPSFPPSDCPLHEGPVTVRLEPLKL